MGIKSIIDKPTRGHNDVHLEGATAHYNFTNLHSERAIESAARHVREKKERRTDVHSRRSLGVLLGSLVFYIATIKCHTYIGGLKRNVNHLEFSKKIQYLRRLGLENALEDKIFDPLEYEQIIRHIRKTTTTLSIAARRKKAEAYVPWAILKSVNSAYKRNKDSNSKERTENEQK